jgi:PilZ domain
VSEDQPVVPAIRDRARLEAIVDEEPLRLVGTVANVTPDEVWVGVEPPHHAQLSRLTDVRLVIMRNDGGTAWADTTLRRVMGAGGRVAALWRPSSWASDARRVHGRVVLRLPAYLRRPGNEDMGSGWTTDISVGGFQCMTDIRLEVGQVMGVSLALSPVTTLSCQAQVMRISDAPEDPSGRRLLAVFKFLDLTETDEAEVAIAMAAID